MGSEGRGELVGSSKFFVHCYDEVLLPQWKQILSSLVGFRRRTEHDENERDTDDLSPFNRSIRQEMREGMEVEVGLAREAGEEWVKGVELLREGEDEEEGDTLVLGREEEREED